MFFRTGDAPWYISPTMQPVAHMSMPAEQSRLPSSSSGARYHRVAT